MKHINCPRCGWPHLDKDWFSVHAHRGHLCSGCGKHFRDVEPSVGNPAWAAHERYRTTTSRRRTVTERLRLRQADYPGGIRIWGSNPAIIWTGQDAEEEGIHVHAFSAEGELPELDGTFAAVEVDGVGLEPELIRTLMAQSALPHISARVVQLSCDSCGRDHRDDDAFAFTPRGSRPCAHCKAPVRSRGRLRNTIGNPILRSLREIGLSAVRMPRQHDIGLLPETL